jgi:predicted AlkP superfamily pyrophosphatase or phosphodiesterase
MPLNIALFGHSLVIFMKLKLALILSLIVGTSLLMGQKKVILIGADGLGSYAFEKAEIPNIRRLMKEGSYSLKARCVLPSSSAVNWASILTGSPPELHGFTKWGSQTPEIKPIVKGEEEIYPTLFTLLEQQKPKAVKGAIYTWGGISHLIEKSILDKYSNPETDSSTIAKSIQFIVEKSPVFTFIHLDEPDHTGHVIGHDTPEYYMALEEIDALLGTFLEALEKEGVLKDYIIVFTADHGGVGKGHGGKSLREMEIPWIIWGRKIKANHEISDAIITYDTGATIAKILGVKPPNSWRGKVVTDAFK